MLETRRGASIVALCCASICLTLGAGCGVDDDLSTSDWSRVGESASAIKDGTTSPEDTNVVGMAIVQGGSIGGCTGSLIAPNLVLTAQHCVSNLSSAQVVCGSATFESTIAPDSFYVSTETQLTPESEFIGVREIVIPPDGTDVCGFDIALMVLDGTITDIEPLVPRVDSDVVPSELYRAVGFGATGQDGGTSFTRRQLGELELKCAGEVCGGSVQATEWLGDRGICQGDSGGPALDSENRVIGVVSRGGFNCSKPVYGSVYAWRDWIIESAQAAALVGGYPVPTWAEPESVGPEGQGGGAIDGAGGSFDSGGDDGADDDDAADSEDGNDEGCAFAAPNPGVGSEMSLVLLGLALATLRRRNRRIFPRGDRQ